MPQSLTSSNPFKHAYNQGPASTAVSNILSIDLEDYYMVSAFEGVVRRKDWSLYESRIERNTYRLLDLLNSKGGLQATFFCLGWVAERHPQLVREIHSRGHEIASHGYDHRMITTMSPSTFREDLRKAKVILEDITGKEVLGYRAPSYSVTLESLWALEILSEEGFLYDSSIFPVHHDRYGIPNAPRLPFVIEMNGNGGRCRFVPLDSNLKPIPNPVCPDPSRNSSKPPAPAHRLFEFPISTLRLLGQNIPVGGGGYFRLLPDIFTRWALRRIKDRDCTPIVFFLHPWEVDSTQPRVKGITLRSRFRHYLNLDKTERRLGRLLQEIEFSSFRNFLTDYGLVPAQPQSRHEECPCV